MTLFFAFSLNILVYLGARTQVTYSVKIYIKQIFLLLFKKGACTPYRRVPSQKTLYINPFMHPCVHECIHAYKHICMHACMCICMHACMHACMHRGDFAPLNPFVKFLNLKKIENH